MQKNEVKEVQINALSYTGEGMVRSKGGSLFVARALPGDTAKVKITRVREEYSHADLLSLVKPSPHRQDSGCKGFDKGCGGCQWLSLKYEEQLAWKTRLLKDQLKFYAGLDVEVPTMLGMKEPHSCRNKFSLLVEEGRLVFMEEKSQKPVVLETCPQETPVIRAVYDKLRKVRFPSDILQLHIRSNDAGRAGLCFFTKTFTLEQKKLAQKLLKEIPELIGIGASSYREYQLLAGLPLLEQEVSGWKYRIPHNGFFQTNTAQAAVLLDVVLKRLSAVPVTNLLDLYCGAGFFSIPAAKTARRVVGIENNEDSIRSAGHNAKLNNIENAEFAADDVKAVLKTLPEKVFDTVIMDPPRAGCEFEVIKELWRLKPSRIIYISCSPEALARDLKLLCEKTYRLVYIQPVDMFPQTVHGETVAELVLR